MVFFVLNLCKYLYGVVHCCATLSMSCSIMNQTRETLFNI